MSCEQREKHKAYFRLQDRRTVYNPSVTCYQYTHAKLLHTPWDTPRHHGVNGKAHASYGTRRLHVSRQALRLMLSSPIANAWANGRKQCSVVSMRPPPPLAGRGPGCTAYIGGVDFSCRATVPLVVEASREVSNRDILL